MRGVVGPRVRTGRFASHIDFRSARGLSEAEEGHGPEDARTRRTGTRLDRRVLTWDIATSLAGGARGTTISTIDKRDEIQAT